MRYSWPGNVRELRNLIERIVIMNPTTTRFDRKHLPPLVYRDGSRRAPKSEFSTLHQARDAYERDYILKKLDENHGNVTRTAGDARPGAQPSLSQDEGAGDRGERINPFQPIRNRSSRNPTPEQARERRRGVLLGSTQIPSAVAASCSCRSASRRTCVSRSGSEVGAAAESGSRGRSRCEAVAEYLRRRKAPPARHSSEVVPASVRVPDASAQSRHAPAQQVSCDGIGTETDPAQVRSSRRGKSHGRDTPSCNSDVRRGVSSRRHRFARLADSYAQNIAEAREQRPANAQTAARMRIIATTISNSIRDKTTLHLRKDILAV